MILWFVLLVFLSLVIGGLRFILPVSGQVVKADIYKDCAHLFVGGLFGAALATGDMEYWIMAVGLTLLEVVAFVVRRKKPE
jgi:hypothetical protein